MKPIKVLAYITRNSLDGLELLVFNHFDIPQAGTQVVAGTVDSNESLEEAILREVHEEAGLTGLEIARKLLTTDHFHPVKQQLQTRNYFHLTAPKELPQVWSHTVSAGDEDGGMVFDFFWIGLPEAQDRLADDQGQAIGELYTSLALQYIGRSIAVAIDRPLHSKHPKYNFNYELNYGYVPGTTSGDGEELDAYVMGIDEPLKTFTGKCIAVIHRTNDSDDKLIIIPEGMIVPSEDDIRAATKFQEQYFESVIYFT